MNNDKIINKKANNITSKLLTDREIHQQIIERFERELELLPEGGLCRKKINGKFYFYHYIKTNDERNPLNQKCISKDEGEFASSLKRKQFIQKSLPNLRNNVKAMDAFLKKYKPYDAADIVAKLSKVYDDLQQICYLDISENVEVSTWLDEHYKNNKSYPEGLIHGTICGKKVRSKSEAIIAGLLEINNIPFRYEAELKIDGHIYYPDFTVLKPRDGEIIYWEHFGMVNNTEYSLSMEQKLAAYRRNEIIPWDKLIATYDCKNGSIDAQTIQNIVKAFIL